MTVTVTFPKASRILVFWGGLFFICLFLGTTPGSAQNIALLCVQGSLLGSSGGHMGFGESNPNGCMQSEYPTRCTESVWSLEGKQHHIKYFRLNRYDRDNHSNLYEEMKSAKNSTLGGITGFKKKLSS